MFRSSLATKPSLSVYLLGTVDFDSVLRLQRRLHFDVSGDRDRACLIVCEHPPLITMGRHASRTHLAIDPDEHGWQVRWVARGGGCWLHLPGQFALYAIVPLDHLGLTVPQYLIALADTLARTFEDFSVHKGLQADVAGLWVGRRLAAVHGIAVRNQVTSFGAGVNFAPDLEMYRGTRCHPASAEPMTSLVRERHGPVRAALFRERLVDHFRQTFGFSDLTLFSDHPLLHDVVRHGEPGASATGVGLRKCDTYSGR